MTARPGKCFAMKNKCVTQYTRHEISMLYREAKDKDDCLDLLCDLTGYSMMTIMEILRFEGLVKDSEIEPIAGMELYDQVVYLWNKKWKNTRISRYLGCDMNVIYFVKRQERAAANG